MMGDESKNMDNSVGERYRERSQIKAMNDHYCKSKKGKNKIYQQFLLKGIISIYLEIIDYGVILLSLKVGII